MKKLIFTPFSILLTILLLISLVVTINGFFVDNQGGNSLVGFIALIFALSFLGVFAIEQAVIKNIKPKMKLVWILESVVIILLLFIWGINGFAFSIG